MKIITALVAWLLIAVLVRANEASLYFTNAWTKRIHRYDLDASPPVTVIDFGGGAGPPFMHWLQAIEIDGAGGKMYWADAEAHTIERANLNGTGRETLYTSYSSGFGPIDLAIDFVNELVFFQRYVCWSHSFDEFGRHQFTGCHKGAGRPFGLGGRHDP